MMDILEEKFDHLVFLRLGLKYPAIRAESVITFTVKVSGVLWEI